jgi:hypothetical protein
VASRSNRTFCWRVNAPVSLTAEALEQPNEDDWHAYKRARVAAGVRQAARQPVRMKGSRDRMQQKVSDLRQELDRDGKLQELHRRLHAFLCTASPTAGPSG